MLQTLKLWALNLGFIDELKMRDGVTLRLRRSKMKDNDIFHVIVDRSKIDRHETEKICRKLDAEKINFELFVVNI